MAEIRMLQEQQQQLQAAARHAAGHAEDGVTKLDDQSAAHAQGDGRSDAGDRPTSATTCACCARRPTTPTCGSRRSRRRSKRCARPSRRSQRRRLRPRRRRALTDRGRRGSGADAAAAPTATTNRAARRLAAADVRHQLSTTTPPAATTWRSRASRLHPGVSATPKAAEAQLQHRHSYYNQGKWPKPRDAFQKVITDYPQRPIACPRRTTSSARPTSG